MMGIHLTRLPRNHARIRGYDYAFQSRDNGAIRRNAHRGIHSKPPAPITAHTRAYLDPHGEGSCTTSPCDISGPPHSPREGQIKASFCLYLKPSERLLLKSWRPLALHPATCSSGDSDILKSRVRCGFAGSAEKLSTSACMNSRAQPFC
jgi:hypothetical protein